MSEDTDELRAKISPGALSGFADTVKLSDEYLAALVSASRSIRNHESALRFVAAVCEAVLSDKDDALNTVIPPPYDAGGTAVAAMLYPLGFIACFDHTRRVYSSRRIPDSVLEQTMRIFLDLCRETEAATGTPGFYASHWLLAFFRAKIFQLGRLQFMIEPFPHECRICAAPTSGDAAARMERCISHGKPGLSVHVPSHGRLERSAVVESLKRSKAFFARHFPDYQVGAWFISSWLLDPQLRLYLPETANIDQFQQLWRYFEIPAAGDKQFFDNLFPRQQPSWDKVTATSSLQAAAIDHVRRGGRWRESGGVMFAEEIEALR